MPRLLRATRRSVGAVPYTLPLLLSRRWFDEYEQEDFARAGTVASKTVELPEGPLPMFQHTMEPMLRTKSNTSVCMKMEPLVHSPRVQATK